MIGEPDAGNPHVRFDEGRQETCVRAARLSPTLRSPREHCSFAIDWFRRPAPSQISLFRRIHVSAFNFCMSLFRCSGVAIIIQPRWASEQPRLPVRRRKSLLPRALRLAIDLLLGEYPPSCFSQVAPDCDHGLLMILGALDPLIQPQCMGSREPTLVDHDQVACLYKSPLQIAVHIPANLAHAGMTAAGMHAWHQAPRSWPNAPPLEIDLLCRFPA